MPVRGASGQCLCGACRFMIDGVVRDAVVCHCVECRRFHGASVPMVAAFYRDLVFERDAPPVRWVDSPASADHARRASCAVCGSSLFWRPRDADTVCIPAGCLDEPTRIRIIGHWYSHQRPDYDTFRDDELPRDDPATTRMPDL